ncbi:related to RRP9 - protein associated with the U3 small nucleolar RNA [Ustilago trichophora]|uniref:Related to RRP9 - protein associated with the U3 small nucleolar RNA n=1 Tax=Ustilago trichophora TaxID=86804 RepID=A0A5C3E3G2_9BASI|nr:related to RRP9 - protein associated with the U3 small nucleolar RNA [Ustilago trichophora]
MPDAFFQKKRKRTNTSSSSSTGGSSSRAGPSRTTATTKSNITSNSQSRMRKRRNASPSSSDNDDDAVPGGGIDEMDLSHNYNQAPNSDDEAEAAETPAEARVRLAKMYLQGLSSSNSATVEQRGDGDDFFESDERPTFGLADAAVADRENIAARLQKDVAEQSGRLHLFLSDRIAPPLSTTTLSEQDNVDQVQAERGVDYSASMLALRGGHRQSVTCAVASQDAKWLFTASKDGSIIRWRLRDGKLIRILPRRSTHLAQDGSALPPTSSGKSKSSGAARRRARLSKPSSSTSIYLGVGAEQGHTDELYTLSLSSDGTHLASGGADKRICIWSVSQPCSESFVKTLSGHKDSISSVCFRLGSQELYTASLDRTLKLFDVSQLSYIETLFGHQESILSLSCLASETAITAGGRDRTCRYWKIRDESQLVFRAGIKSKLREVIEGGELSSKLSSGEKEGGVMGDPIETQEGSVEVVSMIDSYHFLSGGDSGTISLWNLGKKKPIFSFPVAHGFQVVKSESEGEIRSARWITSLACLAYGDLFVSGSWDGRIRVWGLTTHEGGQVKGFRWLFDLPVQGVINSLQIIQPPLSSVRIENHGLISTTAIQNSLYKRQHGLSTPLDPPSPQQQEEGRPSKPLDIINKTKTNSPPIIIAAIGKEHKFGRWINIKNAKNGSIIIPLLLKNPSQLTSTKPNNKKHPL